MRGGEFLTLTRGAAKILRPFAKPIMGTDLPDKDSFEQVESLFKMLDDVRALFPEAVDIRIEAAGDARQRRPDLDRGGQSPHDLFAAYLAEQKVDAVGLLPLFDELLDELSEGGGLADAS